MGSQPDDHLTLPDAMSFGHEMEVWGPGSHIRSTFWSPAPIIHQDSLHGLGLGPALLSRHLLRLGTIPSLHLYCFCEV